MPVTLSKAARSELDTLLDGYPQAEHPGTAVGVVNSDGDVLYLRATGLKDLATGETYDDDTVFWIASCTKLVTSVAALQLVERGAVDLDGPLNSICPELKDKDVVVSSTDTHIETRKANTPITLRMLLTHTAGFTYPWYSEHILRWTKLNNKENIFRPDDMPLVHEPGTRFDYGVSMDWVGTVIERVSGQTMDQYCNEHIFKPLGMLDSTWDLATRPDLKPRLAVLHGWDAATNKFARRDFPQALTNVYSQSGGGGLMTTVPNYLKLLATVLNGGTSPNTGAKILKAQTVKDLFTDQCADLPDKGALGTQAKVESANKGVAAGALELLPGERKGWGLGHLLNLDDIPNGRKANSGEWGGVANLFWLADPTSKIGMVVFNEVLPYGMPAFFKLETDLQGVVYAPGALVET